MSNQDARHKLVQESPRWLYRVCFLTFFATFVGTVAGIGVIIHEGPLWALIPLVVVSVIIIRLVFWIDYKTNKKHDDESLRRLTAHLHDNYSLIVFPSELKVLCEYNYNGSVRRVKAESLLTGKQTEVGVCLSEDKESLLVYKLTKLGEIKKLLKKTPIEDLKTTKQYA